MSSNILVTGGAGYIGSILCPQLVEKGYKVTVVDKFMYESTGLFQCCLNDNFEVIEGDCRDENLMKKLIKKNDIIIPLAALVGAPLCNKDKIAAQTTNFDAIKLIIDNCSKDQKIIYPTTNSGYGIGEKNKYCTEETPLRPISLYGVTKSDAERILLERGEIITFRLATVFGMSPRMRLDLLVNDFTYRAVTDRTVVVFEGHFKRNYIHIRDVARVFIHSIENFDKMKNNTYNIGLDEANLSKIELCELIKKHVPEFVFMESPIGEDPDKRDYIVSNAKIAGAGFKTSFTIDDGVRELIKGYKMLKKNRYSNV